MCSVCNVNTELLEGRVAPRVQALDRRHIELDAR